jgi:hypothetical protein
MHSRTFLYMWYTQKCAKGWFHAYGLRNMFKVHFQVQTCGSEPKTSRSSWKSFFICGSQKCAKGWFDMFWKFGIESQFPKFQPVLHVGQTQHFEVLMGLNMSCWVHMTNVFLTSTKLAFCMLKESDKLVPCNLVLTSSSSHDGSAP